MRVAKKHQQLSPSAAFWIQHQLLSRVFPAIADDQCKSVHKFVLVVDLRDSESFEDVKRDERRRRQLTVDRTGDSISSQMQWRLFRWDTRIGYFLGLLLGPLCQNEFFHSQVADRGECPSHFGR